jgi:predicted MPP superfamily phosphohydrolase
MTKQAILHLSDLHFGGDKSESARAARKLALDGLASTIRSLESEWQPTILCISGDIAFKGIKSDYDEASAWLRKLLADLKLSADHVLICAGNHDIDRTKVNYARPSNPTEADQMLSMPLDSKYEAPFSAYADFAREFGIEPLRLGKDTSHVVGQRELEGISFCSLNSAWFCKDEFDQNRLWMGLPHVNVLEAAAQIKHPKDLAASQPTVFLLHHPKEWFHPAEIHAFGGRVNTLDVVAQRCHLILTGHTHGESRRPDRIGGAAHMMTGGAAFDSATYNNSFTIIRVGQDRFTYRTFEFDPRSGTREWRQTIEATDIMFRDSVVQGAASLALSLVPQLDTYRQAARSYAQDAVNEKSRALRPHGALPGTIDSFVTIEADRARPRNDRSDKFPQPRDSRPISLIDAVRSAKRTLLLGDLGSGKSTLAARFVTESQDRTTESLALLVPAKYIPTPSQPGTPQWKGVRDFIGSLSAFVDNQILPTTAGFNLLSLLDSNIEVALIVDGLDEVSPTLGREILSNLAVLVDRWSTAQVVATGRPVELAGFDYGKWQVCSPLPVQDDDKLLFFAGEAIADGRDEDSAIATATTALQRLRALPELHFLADTPLFCRLLFDQLQKQEQDEIPTLGDLLYKLLGKRLSEWATEDAKSSTTVQFDELYPSADSRVKLLSSLTADLDKNKLVPIERVQHLLETLLPTSSQATKAQLASQALRTFQSAGLVSLDAGKFELSLRSFEDFCRGYALADVIQADTEKLKGVRHEEWRNVSFAATMVRRLGATEAVRTPFCDYVRDLLQTSKNVAAAAYIVSESRDQSLAICFVEQLSQMGRRPLSFSFENPVWPQVAQATAESLYLAGDRGFDWFFREYIDPRYPFVFVGGQITVEIFQRWAALYLGRLTERQKASLTSMIDPHVSAGSQQAAQVIPVLAVVIPGAFETVVRLKHCIRLLENPFFRDAAERRIRDEFENGDQANLRKLFHEAVYGGSGQPYAALLYLTLYKTQPSPRIIRAVLAAPRGRKPDRLHQRTIQRLKELLGIECFERFCRWYLFDGDTTLAAGAAIELFRSGERRLSLLSYALIQGLHDGGNVPQAEEIMSTLLSEEAHSATETLAKYILMNSQAHGHGGHSSWWRLFLQFIRDPALRGPELLVDCLRGVGEFLLPRNPEIRSAFRDLVLGPQSSDFRGALHDALNHDDPEVRHGAAMILISCDPDSEGQALEIVVRWKSHHDHHAWWEWEQYCLTLPFGPSALTYLQSRLRFLPTESRVFALAILFQNGMELDDDLFHELISGSLASVFGSDILGAVVHEERIREALIRAVNEDSEESARKAAEVLLDQPVPLEEDLYARCKALVLNNTGWRDPKFLIELERLRNDPAYAALMVKEAHRLVERGFGQPIIAQLFEADQNPAIWEDLIWSEICSTKPGYRVDPHGQWILDFMDGSATSKGAIGKAARKFLYDSRLTQAFNSDEAQSWLALLAHEAGELTDAELADVVDRLDPIDQSAYVPLVTRLGGAPKNNGRRRRSQHLPEQKENQKISAESATFEQFLEYARATDTLHPEFCTLMEQSLFNNPFSVDELRTLGMKSLHGALVSGALSTVYDRLPDPDWAIIAIGQKRPGGLQNQHCMTVLQSVWRIALYVAKNDQEWRSEYIAKLRENLPTSGENLSAIAQEVLEIDGALSIEHLDAVLRRLIVEMFDNYELVASLSWWLSQTAAIDVIRSVSPTIDVLLSQLDLEPWNVDAGHPKDAGAYLLLPLLRWVISGATDVPSRRVFLHGMKMALTPPRRSGRELTGLPKRLVSIEDIASLLRLVDRRLLVETLQYGLTLNDRELRTLCYIFSLRITDGIIEGSPKVN